MFVIPKLRIMNSTKFFARVVCWRYWKQPHREFEGVGQLTHAGFVFPKTSNYDYKQPFKRNSIEIN